MREITPFLTANLSEERQILAIARLPPSKLPQRLEQTDLSFSVVRGSKMQSFVPAALRGFLDLLLDWGSPLPVTLGAEPGLVPFV